MQKIRTLIVETDMITAYGMGADACWHGLMSHTTAIDIVSRFSVESFQAHNAALIKTLNPHVSDSLIMQMLEPLLQNNATRIPNDALLLLATTTGEIDLLEKAVDQNSDTANESSPVCLLKKIQDRLKLKEEGSVISAACASSNAAVAEAASLIERGEKDCVLVVACDAVTEFVYAGFSSLMALDTGIARPFDADRQGLSLGDAAGMVLLMSDERARTENRTVHGEIAGWALTSDANHMTAPMRDGSGLAQAIVHALDKADKKPEDIGSISAHGTGTIYNDAMECCAFKSVFDSPVPTYSIKGGTGHTMGASGLVELIIALQSIHKKMVPPTMNMTTIDATAEGWVSTEACAINAGAAISTSSGFGGVNAVLVIKGDS